MIESCNIGELMFLSMIALWIMVMFIIYHIGYVDGKNKR